MKELIITTKIKGYTMEECSNEQLELINQAKEACESAYAPYSKYQVGAAVLLEDGTIVQGNNQENAAYPSGLCAERTALFYASSKYPHLKVEALAIIAKFGDDFTREVCSPCGGCRQVVLEIENRHKHKINIYMCSKDTVKQVESIKCLLPLSFGELPEK